MSMSDTYHKDVKLTAVQSYNVKNWIKSAQSGTFILKTSFRVKIIPSSKVEFLTVLSSPKVTSGIAKSTVWVPGLIHLPSSLYPPEFSAGQITSGSLAAGVVRGKAIYWKNPGSPGYVLSSFP